MLLQEETGAPGENLQCSVESNWTTLFSRDARDLWSYGRHEFLAGILAEEYGSQRRNKEAEATRCRH